VEYRMDQPKGEDFRKSLGIMIGEFADVHKAQDPAVAQSMMIALAKVNSKKLTRAEMQTLMVSVGIASIMFDPLGTNVRLATIRKIQRRQMYIAGRALAVRRYDRKYIIYAPLRLGGNAQRYFLAEHVLSLVRELSYYLNISTRAGRVARAKVVAAKISKDRSDTITIKDAVHKLAVCGLHLRDRNEEIISRILDFMASSSLRGFQASNKRPDLINWTQETDPAVETVEYLTRFSFDSQTAQKLRQIYDKVEPDGIVQLKTYTQFMNAIIKDLEVDIQGWSEILEDQEIRDMHRAVQWAGDSFVQDWRNSWEVQVQYETSEGTVKKSVCPMVPEDGLIHSGCPKGIVNIRRAVLERYRKMPKCEITNGNLCDMGERYSDGSFNRDTSECGFAIVFSKSAIQDKFSPNLIISKRLPNFLGTQRSTINIAETEAMAIAVEKEIMVTEAHIWTDSQVAKGVSDPKQFSSIRVAMREPFSFQRWRVQHHRSYIQTQSSDQRINDARASLSSIEPTAVLILEARARREQLSQLEPKKAIVSKIECAPVSWVPSHQKDNQDADPDQIVKDGNDCADRFEKVPLAFKCIYV
jgi:ribonuclease HI